MNRIHLEMKNINKSYDSVLVVKNVSAQFNGGEIHALMGANGAGKSTLMNVLSGSITADSGEVFIDGKKVEINNIRDAEKLGIVMIHQELNLMDDLSIAQNIFINNEPLKGLFIDDEKMIEDSKKLLHKVGLNVDPRTLVKDLSVGKRQMVEIAKALSKKSRVLILDEPTAALSASETEELFKIMQELKAEGICLIYISHRMYEIFRISEKITVMKDGEFVICDDTKNISEKQLIYLMVGRDLDDEIKDVHENNNKVVLQVKNLYRSKVFHDISFSLKKGEILGFYGLVGAGRTEIARAIMGIDNLDGGEIFINGKKVEIRHIGDAIKNGLCYLSEDRRRDGMLFKHSLVENSTIASLDDYDDTLGIINDRKCEDDFKTVNELISTKYRDNNQYIETLSGGNQQKVLLSRWLLKDSDILILDEPTRGIDVGAKDEIYDVINELVKKGKSIIVISSEGDELKKICDRILVVCEGRISADILPSEAEDDVLLDYATD